MTGLEYATKVICLLSPNLEYKNTHKDGFEHRADKAAWAIKSHMHLPTHLHRVWCIQSATDSDLWHFASLEDLVCDCDDFNKSGACWHLIAAAMAEAACRRCETCHNVMSRDAKFDVRYDVYGDRQFIGAYVCDTCQVAHLDTGEKSSLRDMEVAA